MAVNSFTHPKFSFFNNTPPSFLGVPIITPECITDIASCLPMANFDDASFQVYVNTFGDPIAFINDNRYALYPVKGTACERPDGYFNVLGTTPLPVTYGKIYSNSPLTDFNDTVIGDIPSPYVGVINFDDFRIGDIDAWNASVADEWKINVGDCFHLQIYQVGCVAGNVAINVAEPIVCSPCFIRTEECYTSIIYYGCNENVYDFFFHSSDEDYQSFSNKIRLPFYLKNPQLPSEESSYRKSDGTYIKLSERIEEEYSLETDWMPHDWHRKLKVALGCDYVTIQNPNIQQQAYLIPNLIAGVTIQVICKEPYEIEWQEDVPQGAYIHAKAKTKVKMSEAVSYINSNCV